MFSRVTPELSPRQIPESAVLRSSRHRQLEVPGFRMSVTLFLHEPRFPNFTLSRIRGFTGSRLPKIVSFLPLKTCLKNFVKLNVSRVTGFPEFPNTSPSGKRVDSDFPIPRILRKFSKKRHPRNVGGDTRRPGALERLDRGRFRGTTPPRPYK
jgi:hypothetical protein